MNLVCCACLLSAAAAMGMALWRFFWGVNLQIEGVYLANTGRLDALPFLNVHGQQIVDPRWLPLVVFEVTGIVVLSAFLLVSLAERWEGVAAFRGFSGVFFLGLAFFGAADLLASRMIYACPPWTVLPALLPAAVWGCVLLYRRAKSRNESAPIRLIDGT